MVKRDDWEMWTHLSADKRVFILVNHPRAAERLSLSADARAW